MDLCLIILRCVNNADTEKIWRLSYRSARNAYPDTPIIVIDDNSSIPPELDNNTKLISSEFPQRGEILPYLYYYKHKFAETAIIIHDSVILNGPINHDVETYKIIWEFNRHEWDFDHGVVDFLFPFGSEMIDLYYRKLEWGGCFGGMTIINHDFLKRVISKHDFLSHWIPKITNRFQRMHFERALAVVLICNDKVRPSLFGDIHQWAEKSCPGKVFGKLNLSDYNPDLPIFKIWVGR